MVWTAEAFLQKRYEAGQSQRDAQILKFLEEHPDATAAQLREFLINSRNRNRPNSAAQ